MPILRYLKQSSLSTQWLILGIALVTLGGAVGFNLYFEHGRTENRERERLLTQSRVIQENIEQNLAAVSAVLDALPAHMSARDSGEHTKMLTEAMPGVRTLLLLDAKGSIYASNRRELIGKNFAYRDYFKVPQQKPDPAALFVSPPYMTTSGRWVISVTRRLSGPRGEFAGVASATLDPEYFKTLMASVLYAPDMWTALAHGDGLQFLMIPERKGQPGKNLAQPGSLFTRHMEGGRSASIQSGTVFATGEERLMAVRTVRPAGLKLDKALVVAVSRDRSVIFEPWRRDAKAQGALFILIALLSAGGLHSLQQRQREFDRQAVAANKALQESESFMRMLTDNIPGMVGYWTEDLRCGFANRNYFEWFGRTPEQMRGIRIQDLMGETLFARNEPYIRAALRGERQQFERTLTKADGSIGHTWAQYIPDREGERVRGFFVLVSDITALKQAEIALAESELKLRTIVEIEPECVKVLAPDGSLLQMNRAGLDMIEADSEKQVIGRMVADLVVPEHRAAFLALNERVNRGESGELEFEIVGLRGGRRWLETHAVPMRDADGRVTGLLSVTLDITQRKSAQQALEQLAQTDSLTGLANRRHFLQRAEQELSRTIRYGGVLSVLMLDIDHFKAVNDTYGHKVGDSVLQHFAAICREALRDIDVVGRMGGEEFAVVLPQTDLARALEVAERLRATIADAGVAREEGLPIRYTVSIGTASLATADTNIDTLLSQADTALYRAKEAGRNRVCGYEPPGGESPAPTD